MSRIVHLENVRRDDNSVVTVGTFDGIHTGHRVLVSRVLERAAARNARSVVVTFHPHPRSIIHPGEPGIRLLTTLEERAELLSEMGIDEMVVIPFDRDFSLLGSREFIEQVLWERIGVSELVVGYDHQFGKNREGTIETVRKLGNELGFRVEVVSRQEYGEHTISSSAIRRALQEEGDVSLAARLLGRPYLLRGTVVHGDGRGRSIGFPTANILPDSPEKVIPGTGVYAVRVDTDRGGFNGMMNIGVRPTFHGTGETLEVHLLDFKGDLYGTAIEIRFVERIRDEKKFDRTEELVRQIERDREATRHLLEERNGLP